MVPNCHRLNQRADQALGLGVLLHPLRRIAPHLGLLGLFGLAGLAALPPARAGMVENMILSKCSSQMGDEFKKAGQTPPPGMVHETCHCVLKGWQQKQGLDQAIKSCSAASTAKYGVNTNGQTPTAKGN